MSEYKEGRGDYYLAAGKREELQPAPLNTEVEIVSHVDRCARCGGKVVWIKHDSQYIHVQPGKGHRVGL